MLVSSLATPYVIDPPTGDNGPEGSSIFMYFEEPIELRGNVQVGYSLLKLKLLSHCWVLMFLRVCANLF